MQISSIVCHYAEIGIKGDNKSYFERYLKDNIKQQIRGVSPGLSIVVRMLRGRILVELSESGIERIDEIIEALKNVFGLAFFTLAVSTKQDIEEIKKVALALCQQESFDTFRVKASRSDKNFPLTSMEIDRTVGEVIFETMNKTVKLKGADLVCGIELVNRLAFIHVKRFAGRGGFPVGVSGKILLMLSGGFDSPVAAFYAMKRGATPVYLHFHSVPITDDSSIIKARQLVKALNKFQPYSKLLLCPLAPVQQAIMHNGYEKYRIILYRRFMFRIAEKISKQFKSGAIYTGESLGQVASQTIPNMAAIEIVTKIPILRPLIGFDKQEIINKAEEINTAEISILPDEDCCSLFTPKHPVTKAHIPTVELAEEGLEIDALVDEAIQGIIVEGIGR